MSGARSTGEVAFLIEPTRLARESVVELPRYKTGVSPHLLKALDSGASVTRLGSNENLYGASPRVDEAIRSVRDVNLYPDGENTVLRQALAAHLGVDADRVIVSTGSENVLSALFQCVLAPGDSVVTLAPTFMLAEILTRALGAVHVGVSYGDDLDYSAEALVDAVNAGPKIVYISNPNNPTGNAFSPDELSRIVSQTSPSTLVVVDEAYYEYARRHDGFESSLPVLDACGRPYVVLRTFSKAYGLAGLRVGYGICYHPELLPLVRRASTVFDVGAISQTAALAALGDQAHMEQVVDKTLVEKQRLLSALAEREMRVFPAFGNFVSLWFHDHREALELENNLAQHSVFVKALPARPSEGVVRVSVGRPQDTDRFLDVLARIS